MLAKTAAITAMPITDDALLAMASSCATICKLNSVSSVQTVPVSTSLALERPDIIRWRRTLALSHREFSQSISASNGPKPATRSCGLPRISLAVWRSERCAGDASACNSRICGFSCGKRHPHHVLLQQIERYRQQNQILHQERHVARHRRKSGNRIPAVRHERDDGDGRYECRTRAERSENSQFLVPESQEQERGDQPFPKLPGTNS